MRRVSAAVPSPCVSAADDGRRGRARARLRSSGACAPPSLALALLLVASPALSCPGDCNADGRVEIAELVAAVGIALGARPLADCPPADGDADQRVAIDDLLAAVAGALDPSRCAPTAAPSPSPTPTPLPVAERRVNQRTAGSQRHPDLALHPAGGALVVWSGPAGAPERARILARRLDAAGTPTGDELVLSDGDADDTRPRIAALADGGFAVVWERNAAGRSDVRLRLFDAAGQPLAPSQRVPTSGRRRQERPAIAATPDGGFAVVWQADDSTDGSRRDDVHARAFDADARPRGDERRVNQREPLDHWQHDPDVSTAPDGRVLVVWARSTFGSVARGIGARWLDAAGAPLGDEVAVHDLTALVNEAPTASVGNGDVPLVLWSRRDDGDAHARLIASRDGVVAPFREGTAAQAAPILASGGGQIVAAWQEFAADGDRWDAYAQHLTPPGAVFRLHDHVANSQEAPRLAVAASGALFAVWQSFGQDGSGYGVYARVFE